MATGALIQLNPLGMLATEDGYISSIDIRASGAVITLTPDASNQVGAGVLLPNTVVTRLCEGFGSKSLKICLVTGATP